MPGAAGNEEEMPGTAVQVFPSGDSCADGRRLILPGVHAADAGKCGRSVDLSTCNQMFININY